jgi:hypothetical protein
LDSDGNPVTAKFQALEVNNEDIYNKMQNIDQKTQQLEEKLEDGGVGDAIFKDGDDLKIEAQDVKSDKMESQKYQFNDIEGNSGGYISKPADSPFMFYTSTTQGAAILGAISCSSIGLGNGAYLYGRNASDGVWMTTGNISMTKIDDSGDASIRGFLHV